MALSEPYELDGVTVGTTEYSIPNNANYSSASPITADHVAHLWLDIANVVKGDRYEVKFYEKCLSGSTQRLLARWTTPISGSGSTPENMVTPSFMLMHGWDMTIKKLAGTDRAFDASIRSVATTITEAYNALSATTVSTTEVSIVSGTTTQQTITTDGVYQLVLDPFNMAKGDAYKVRLKETVEGTGGTKRTFQTYILKGVQSELFATPAFTLINGWDMTIVRTAGADRAFSGSIRKVG